MQAMAKNTIEKAIYNRTELLLGDDVMEALAAVRVIIFGVGGVGSWCAEGLVRSGITKLTIVDSDRICITNVNRQLMATTKTVGQVKVDALKAHLLEINPKAEVTAVQQIYCEETAGQFNLDEYDYVIDAVDSLKDKVHLILNATSSKAKFFCSLGGGAEGGSAENQGDGVLERAGMPVGGGAEEEDEKGQDDAGQEVPLRV